MEVVKFSRVLSSRCVEMSFGTRSCRTSCLEAVLQTDFFLSWPKTGLQVTTNFFRIPQVFFGDDKILA